MSQKDVKIIPASFQKAISHAFKVQLSAVASVKKVSFETKVFDQLSIECLSTVQLKSPDYAGSLSLGFGKHTFLNLLFRMIGEKFEQITPENSDASSEILNIIFANARKEINESGFEFEPAIPSTVIGQKLIPSKSNMSGQLLIFECESEFGDFLVTLSLKSTSGS